MNKSVFFVLVFFPVVAFSQNKWKIAQENYHFFMQGVKAADKPPGYDYDFDTVTATQSLLNTSYFISPTLSVDLNLEYKSLYAETVFGSIFTKDRTTGFGDTKLSLTKTWVKPSGFWTYNLGLSIPTGSITKKNKFNRQLNYPYNMQLGTGTYDIQTYGLYVKPIGQKHFLSALVNASLTTGGYNSQGYKRGNEYLAKLSYSYQLGKYFTPGLWLNYRVVQGIDGKDQTLDDPISDEFLKFYYNSSSYWDATLFTNWQYPIKPNFKLKGSAAVPLYQHSRNVDDIQIYLRWYVSLGVEVSL